MCRSDTSETKTQQKRAFPCAIMAHILSYGFSMPCKRQALISSLPPHPHQARFYSLTLSLGSSPVLNIVSCLSPPPHSFAVWRLHIKYLLLVLLSSAVGIGKIVRQAVCCERIFKLRHSVPLLYFATPAILTFIFQNHSPSAPLPHTSACRHAMLTFKQNYARKYFGASYCNALSASVLCKTIIFASLSKKSCKSLLTNQIACAKIISLKQQCSYF